MSKTFDINALRRQADDGDPLSMIELGRCYLLGRQVGEDLNKAAFYFEKALSAGDIDGQVGLHCIKAKQGSQKDKIQAGEFFKLAAVKDSGFGQYMFGRSSLKPGDADRCKLGVEFLLKALDNASAPVSVRVDAAMKLALSYKDGKGVAGSDEKYLEFIEKAANLGDTAAQVILASRLLAGKGIKKDAKRGFDLILAAAQSGDGNSAAVMGSLYEWGQEFPASFSRADEFYALAAGNGHVIAPHNRLALALTTGSTTVCVPDYEKLDVARLSLNDLFIVAFAADLNGDETRAMRFYRLYIEHPKSLEQWNVAKEAKRLVYYRPAATEYFHALAAGNALKRFNKRNITVYIPTESGQFSAACKDIILDCFRQWCSALDGRLTVHPVRTDAGADIKFSPVNSELFFGVAGALTCGASSLSKEILPEAKEIVIELPPRDLLSDDDKANFASTCLHEIGHALGLYGHSLFPCDVMYSWAKHQTKLSQRDVQAIRCLYADDAQAQIMDIVQKQAARKDPYAQAKLGLYLLMNEKNQEALPLLEDAAASGDAVSNLILARIHIRQGNLLKYKQYIDRAADLGLPVAKLASPSTGKDPDAFIKTLQVAAGGGNVMYMNILATMHALFGDDRPVDGRLAEELFERAASRGSKFAKTALAAGKALDSAKRLFSRKGES